MLEITVLPENINITDIEHPVFGMVKMLIFMDGNITIQVPLPALEAGKVGRALTGEGLVIPTTKVVPPGA